jgi:hypothetical protein
VPHKGWELEELVRLNEFRGKVSHDTKWNIGKYGIQLDLIIDVTSVTDPPDAYYPQTTLWYSVGRKDWAILEGGLKIQGSKPDQKFHASSKYGHLLKAVAELEPEVEKLLEGDPHDASVWWDHIFDFSRVPMKITGLTDEAGGARDVDTTIVVPVTWVGYEGAGGTITPAAAGVDSILSDESAKLLAEAMNGKSDSAGRVAVVRVPALAGNDSFMATFTSEQGYKQIMARMQELNLLTKIGEIWQKPV